MLDLNVAIFVTMSLSCRRAVPYSNAQVDVIASIRKHENPQISRAIAYTAERQGGAPDAVG